MANPVLDADPTAVRLGPGILWIGPVGSTEPTTLSAAIDAAFTQIGYTEEGHAFTLSPSFDPVEVAEEVDPISYEPTSREMRIEFAMAQLTAKNLSAAFNGGDVTTGTGIVTFEPPDLGSEERVCIIWESLDGKERWVYRKCLQVGDVEIARRKAPDKATVPVSFMLEVVSGGGKPFKAILDDTLSGE